MSAAGFSKRTDWQPRTTESVTSIGRRPRRAPEAAPNYRTRG
jgi:hypothetical protein